VVFQRRHVVIPRSDQSIEEVDVIQQGQVFKLTARWHVPGHSSTTPHAMGTSS
jgi:hypothetical protein